MSAVTIRHFVADANDPSIASIVSEAKANAYGRAASQKALANDLGSTLFVMRAGYLSGFCYQEQADVPSGMRLSTTTTHDGKRYFVMVPDRRTKAGKEIYKRLKEANRDSEPFSPAVCRALGIYSLRVGPHAESRTGMAMYETVCGLIGDKVVFKIPFGGSEGGMTETKDPVLPACLKEIPESEFIAITKEGDAK